MAYITSFAVCFGLNNLLVLALYGDASVPHFLLSSELSTWWHGFMHLIYHQHPLCKAQISLRSKSVPTVFMCKPRVVTLAAYWRPLSFYGFRRWVPALKQCLLLYCWLAAVVFFISVHPYNRKDDWGLYMLPTMPCAPPFPTKLKEQLFGLSGLYHHHHYYYCCILTRITNKIIPDWKMQSLVQIQL